MIRTYLKKVAAALGAFALVINVSAIVTPHGSALYGLTTCNAAEREFLVRLLGRSSSITTKAELTVGDIAEVTPVDSEFSQGAIALKRLSLQKSPPPGQTLTLKATDILHMLRSKEVDLSRVGYTLPPTMAVTRAGRDLSLIEARDAIESFLHEKGKEIEIKAFELPPQRAVFPGSITLKVSELTSAQRGKMLFRLLAVNNKGEEVPLDVAARIDEFREIPVASRPLTRGELIGPNDVVMARLNVAELARDVVPETEGLIGLEVKHPMGQGDLFHRNHLVVPPTIRKGETVKLFYQTRLFEASATGVALQNAAEGEQIQVRNSGSKKVVEGRVARAGLVKVGP